MMPTLIRAEISTFTTTHDQHFRGWIVTQARECCKGDPTFTTTRGRQSRPRVIRQRRVHSFRIFHWKDIAVWKCTTILDRKRNVLYTHKSSAAMNVLDFSLNIYLINGMYHPPLLPSNAINSFLSVTFHIVCPFKRRGRSMPLHTLTS